MSKRRRELLAQTIDTNLLYLIKVYDITYGYSNNNSAPPTYISQNNARGIYAPFNILVDAGTYQVNVTSDADDMYFLLQFFSNDQLQKVQNGEYLGSVYSTTGWRKDSYQFSLPISGQEDIAGFRILIAKGANKNQVVDSSLNPRIEIRKVE